MSNFLWAENRGVAREACAGNRRRQNSTVWTIRPSKDYRCGARADAAFIPRRMVAFLRYWLPLILWMGLIFSASADAQSIEHTSRFLEPFLRWLNPDISPRALEAVRWVIRKLAHMVEFGLLTWLLWRALRKPKRNDPRPWSWKTAGVAFGIVVLYAATDEFHQRFVPNRTGSVKDVFIDSAGAALAMMLVWIWYHGRQRPAQPAPVQ